MKKIVMAFVLFSLSMNATNNWGKTGHRTVGKIANEHISRETAKKISQLLDGESLAFVSIYGDEIRSNPKYNSFAPWHYVNFEGDKKYMEDEINPKGDVIQGIKTCVLEVRNKENSKEDRAFYLRMLVHFVGDLHMPLHTGNKHDYGGNKVKIKWFGEPTNLHSLWDSGMIENYKMSYTELAFNLDITSKEENKKLGKGTLVDWAHESRLLALKVYESAKNDENLSYKYMYEQFPLVRTQLQKGGVRLAKVLDEVFKSKSSWLDAFLSNI